MRPEEKPTAQSDPSGESASAVIFSEKASVFFKTINLLHKIKLSLKKVIKKVHTIARKKRV